MGSLVNGKCYASPQSANDAYFGAMTPVVQVAGSATYYTYYTNISGTWVMVRDNISSGGTKGSWTNVTMPVPIFPSCTDDAFVDGMTVGWGIALVIVMAWGFKMMRRQAR